MEITKSKYFYLFQQIEDLYKQDSSLGYRPIAAQLKKSNNLDVKESSIHNFVRASLNQLRGKKGKVEASIQQTHYKSGITHHADGSIIVTGQGKTIEEVLAESAIDLKEWEIADLRIKESQWDVSSKYRDQNLKWSGDGQMQGHAIRKNEFIKTQNYAHSFQIHLKPRFGILHAEKFKQEFIEDLKKYAPTIPKKAYSLTKKGDQYAVEINLFDVHLGRFLWNEAASELLESTQQTEQRFRTAVISLLEQSVKNIEKRDGKLTQIIFPIGNDYFTTDKDSPFPQTTAGTPQQMDLTWQHVYRRGRRLIQEVVEMLSDFAPVYVYVIPGNHDWHKSFYLGDALEVAFENNPNIIVDNSTKPRKYHQFGKSLIGYAHGRYEKERLYTSMQIEKPHEWADTLFREWHLGDKHKMSNHMLEIDYQGVVMKHLRAFTHIDDWEDKMGYYRNIGAEAYIWHKDKGKVAIEFDNHTPKY